MTKFELAVEERKIIQSIIHNRENIRIKILTWCITIITGLTVALYTEKVVLRSDTYFLLSIVIVLVFFIIDVANRFVFHKMLIRSREIETNMNFRNIIYYSGFGIETAMGMRIRNKIVLKSYMKDYSLFLPYVCLTILCSSVFIISDQSHLWVILIIICVSVVLQIICISILLSLSPNKQTKLDN